MTLMSDDPRWAWLEKRLEEIHGDVRRINGNVRRHEADLAVLSTVAHAPGCHVSENLRVRMEDWMREQDERKRAIVLADETEAAVRRRDLVWLGGIVGLLSFSMQILAQWLWR